VLISAAILALAVQAAPQAPPAVGSLAGCATDTTAQRLPGVAVVAKSGPVLMTTSTGADGCFALNDLPAGSYRVTARLPGFDNVTRDRVTVVSGRATRMDVLMRVSAICECVRFGGTTLAEQWDHADAVLHARLSASESQPGTPVGYYRHVATVIEALKAPTGSLEAPVFVLQNQRSAAPGPFDIGQELVVFLTSAGSGGFVITNDEPGLAVPTSSFDPAIVFLVRDGRIQRAPPDFSRYAGLPLDEFLRELRPLSRGK
jgi:hypothetical protein